MAVVRIEVTAEQIAAAGDRRMAWAEPVEAALAALTGQEVSIDGAGPEFPCVATIGQDEWTIVLDLPDVANAWLDARWGQTDPTREEPVPDIAARGEPFAFDLEAPDWIVALVPPADWVTLAEASAALKTTTPNGLRAAARARRDGLASERALAARLGMRRVGRDWLIPRDRLDAEVARRAEAAG